MAQTFKSAANQSITTVTTVLTSPAATTCVIISLIVANTGATDTTVTVSATKSGGSVTNLIFQKPLPGNSNLTVLNSNNRLVLETGDLIKVTAAVATDCYISYLAVT